MQGTDSIIKDKSVASSSPSQSTFYIFGLALLYSFPFHPTTSIYATKDFTDQTCHKSNVHFPTSEFSSDLSNRTFKVQPLLAIECGHGTQRTPLWDASVFFKRNVSEGSTLITQKFL